MSEKDFENQFDTETGYPRPRRGRGLSAISPPPTENEDEFAYIYRAARSGVGSLIPPPPSEGLSHMPPPPSEGLSHMPPPPSESLSHIPPPPSESLSHMPPSVDVATPSPPVEESIIMSKRKFIGSITVTSNGLSKEEARTRIRLVIHDCIGAFRDHHYLEDGSIYFITDEEFWDRKLYCYLESRGNEHSIVVTRDHNMDDLLGCVGLPITLLSFLYGILSKWSFVGSLGFACIALVLGILATLKIINHKSLRKAEADFIKIRQALMAAEKKGEFNN